MWRDLSALDYHYFTQPLPTPLAYYAASAASGLKKLATAAMFSSRLAVPFISFCEAG